MAGRASQVGMSIRKKKSGGAVVKRGGVPTRGSVARRAIRDWERRCGRCVRRILRLLPGGQMAP